MVQAVVFNNTVSSVDLNRLPNTRRIVAAEDKYAVAVELYDATDMTLHQVAEKCGVTTRGLSAHIGRYHRPLLFARYGIDNDTATTFKIKPQKGQSQKTHLKYREAIEACGDIAYIEFNVSQIAHLFDLNGTALASQLRVHYPDVIPHRERLRQRLGIADNTHRGPRRASLDQYSEALEMYRNTNLTIPEVAERCKVSKGGFSQFMRFYHHDVIAAKASRRSEARRDRTSRQAGALSASGKPYGPSSATVERYASALHLYRTTSMTIGEIVDSTGVPPEGFKGYIHKWHRDDMLRRRGYAADSTTIPDLAATKRYLRSTRGKYTGAIESLRNTPRPVAEVAAEFGLHPDVFREYLKTHEPELAAQQGMVRLPDGRMVRKSAHGKYTDAIREYATSTEPLRSIAQRHGIVYKSLMGYLTRNCPAERESHRRLVDESQSSPDNQLMK